MYVIICDVCPYACVSVAVGGEDKSLGGDDQGGVYVNVDKLESDDYEEPDW